MAVVGAWAATGYGEHVAAEFGYGLAEGGVVVVSGAAFGIDGAAHRGTLVAQGRTVAVQACGLDRAYPAGHQRLLDRVAECAAVVSEYSAGVRPARYRFLTRKSPTGYRGAWLGHGGVTSPAARSFPSAGCATSV